MSEYRQFIVIPEKDLINSSITPFIDQAWSWAQRNHRLSKERNVIMIVIGYSTPPESGFMQELPKDL